MYVYTENNMYRYSTYSMQQLQWLKNVIHIHTYMYVHVHVYSYVYTCTYIIMLVVFLQSLASRFPWAQMCIQESFTENRQGLLRTVIETRHPETFITQLPKKYEDRVKHRYWMRPIHIQYIHYQLIHSCVHKLVLLNMYACTLYVVYNVSM